MKELIITKKKMNNEVVNDNKFITSFTGKYEFLSNEFECEIPIEDDNLVFTNVTSALIASKSNDIGTRRKFTRFSANKARKKESNIPDNDYWEENKDDIMYNLIYIKFTHNKELQKKLLDTEPYKLVNSVTYPDTYYGVRFGEGRNMLGHILMKVRDDISKSE